MTRRTHIKNGDRRQSDAALIAEVRACCNTNRLRPHEAGCIRPISRCAQKAAFQNRDRAKAAARRHQTPGDRMVAYHCQGCDLWHIGHPANEGEGL